jgi:HPt (histidine-containing phosphotransfer) domain-containing protein
VGSQVTNLDARMTELVRKFIARTSAELEPMRAALALLDAGDRSGLSEIHQLAHRTCGTGGTLGLLALSDAAGKLERGTEAYLPGGLPNAAQRAQLGADLDAVAAQLALLQERDRIDGK